MLVEGLGGRDDLGGRRGLGGERDEEGREPIGGGIRQPIAIGERGDRFS